MNTSLTPAFVSPSPPIHLAVHKCARGFRDLITAVTAIPRFAAQTRPETINDELDHFKIWVGNIAAHRQGRRSLEYRLRDAAHLKSEVNDLLQVLQNSLAKALAIVNGERIPWDEESDSDSDSESDSKVSDDAGNENPKNDTELKHILITIKSTVTCLFRLSMAIRDPAPNTQLRNFITVDKSYFETYDIPHVQSKFPQAEIYLTERLGRAMTGRRRYLTYREEHHQKLSKNVEEIGHEEPRTEYTTNSTEASLLPAANDETESVVDDSFDILSQTSHATSVNATIWAPALPKQAWDNEQWECPLCYLMVSIHTKAGWKQHVYRDLHPYCCTFEDCTIADRLYDSRRTWFQHELGHRKCWQCVEGCNRSFSGEKDFVAHVQAQHPELTAPNILTALKHTATRSANLSDQGKCPLCNKSMTLRVLQKHLGRHQEQLALFALPQNMDDTGDDREDGKSQASVDVNKWQDEELSDISDTAPSGEDVESEVEDPLPWGATPETALGKLAAIALHLHTELVPPIVAFMQQQPAEESARILEYRRLYERVFTETLLKLDAVETEGNPDARKRRKELVRETRDLLNRLDEARPLVCGHAICRKIFNSSADLRRHYEEMHGENGESLDITQEREEQERKNIEEQIKAEEDRLLYEWKLKLEREDREQMLPKTPEQARAEKDDRDQNIGKVLVKERSDLVYIEEKEERGKEEARINNEEARLKLEWDLKIEREEQNRKESEVREDNRKHVDHSALGRQRRVEDDWGVDDEIAALRLEIAEVEQERSKIASPYGAPHGMPGMPPVYPPYGQPPHQTPPPPHPPSKKGTPAPPADPAPPPPPPPPMIFVPPPPPIPDPKEEEMLRKQEEDEKKAEDAKFARIESLLIAQQEARIQKDTQKQKAAAEAAQAAADAKKRGDEDKLEKLEKLILAQKDEQMKREAAADAERKAEKAEADSKAAAEELEKGTKAAHEKAMVEAKAAEEEAAKLKLSDAPKLPIKFKDAKAQVLAAAPAGSPMKIDRKEKPLGVKKRSLGEMPLPMQMQMGIVENQMALPSDLQVHSGLSLGKGMLERSRPQANNTRPGPSSYWSVTEQNDFQRNVAHFGTDWVSIANHMGTKTHTMVRNQYLRLVEGGLVDDLQKLADKADHKRERGEDLGPPPTPTPAPKRRYESS